MITILLISFNFPYIEPATFSRKVSYKITLVVSSLLVSSFLENLSSDLLDFLQCSTPSLFITHTGFFGENSETRVIEE